MRNLKKRARLRFSARLRLGTRLLLGALLLLAALPLSASGLFDGKKSKEADWERSRSGDKVELSGTVRLVGSEPFTELVITDGEGRDWYVDEGSRALLAALEHRPVRVSGTVTRKEMKLANGTKLPDRRNLADIALLGEGPQPER